MHDNGWRKAAAGLAGVITALAMVFAPGTASAGTLGISQQVQQQNQWCWAASG